MCSLRGGDFYVLACLVKVMTGREGLKEKYRELISFGAEPSRKHEYVDIGPWSQCSVTV